MAISSETHGPARMDKWANMKVLVTCPELQKLGGVANYFRVLRRHFPPNVEYFIIGRKGNKGGLLRDVWRLLKDYACFLRKTRNGNYAIVHLNPSLLPKSLVRDAIFLLIAKSYDKKVIVFFRGWDPKWEHIIRRFFLRFFRFIYFRADAFIVLFSEFGIKLKDMGCPRPIHLETTVAANVIFAQGVAHLDKEKEDGIINILFLTRIERTKGVYEAIEAYRILKSCRPQAMLTLAGDGSEMKRVRAYITEKRIPDVRLLGYVVGNLKQKAFTDGDIYIYPSYFGEGMPNSVVEAMSYGLPIVTRAVGGIRDFFSNGEMGFITESRDPEAFAEMLERLAADINLRQKMGRFNYSYAEAHFKASRVALRIGNIYRELLL